MIWNRQTDLADCGIVAVPQNKTFIFYRVAPAACPSQQGRSLDNWVRWQRVRRWYHRTLSSNKFRFLYLIPTGHPRGQGVHVRLRLSGYWLHELKVKHFYKDLGKNLELSMHPCRKYSLKYLNNVIIICLFASLTTSDTIYVIILVLG